MALLLTDELRRDYSLRIAEDIELLRWSASLLQSLTIARMNKRLSETAVVRTMQTIHLDTFALHTGSLIDFLYLGSAARPEDVVIADYLSPADLARALPPLSPLLAATRHRTRAHTARLSLDHQPCATQSHQCQYGEIFGGILGIFNALAPAFTEASTHAEFRAIIAPPRLPLFRVDLDDFSESELQIHGLILSAATRSLSGR